MGAFGDVRPPVVVREDEVRAYALALRRQAFFVKVAFRLQQMQAEAAATHGLDFALLLVTPATVQLKLRGINSSQATVDVTRDGVRLLMTRPNGPAQRRYVERLFDTDDETGSAAIAKCDEWVASVFRFFVEVADAP